MRASRDVKAFAFSPITRRQGIGDFLWVHLMVTLKMLNEMVLPAKCLLASVTSAKGARILRIFFKIACDMTSQHVVSGEVDPA